MPPYIPHPLPSPLPCYGTPQISTVLRRPVPVRELPSLASLGLADGPVLILGMDLLCRSRAVFCFGSNAVFVQKP